MEALARLTCGASVNGMTTYEIGDSNLLVRQADLTPAPDQHCPQLPWHPAGTGVTFQAPQSAARRPRSLRRAGR